MRARRIKLAMMLVFVLAITASSTYLFWYEYRMWTNVRHLTLSELEQMEDVDTWQIDLRGFRIDDQLIVHRYGHLIAEYLVAFRDDAEEVGAGNCT